RQTFSPGTPTSKLVEVGPAPNRRGTTGRFHPHAEIFGKGPASKPARPCHTARSKAHLQRAPQIRWTCAPEPIKDETPAEAVLHFPNGLADFLGELTKSKRNVVAEPLAGRSEKDGPHGRVEWAITWVSDGFGEADGFLRSYCNTVYTPDGGF